MFSFSFGKKQAFISEDRKVKLISDVDSQVPSKLKKLLSLVEEVIETDENTLLSVYRKIEESGEPINSIYPIIEFAFKIRPLNTNSLLTLHCLLSRMHGYKNENEVDDRLFSMLLQQGIICKEKKTS